MSVVVVDSGGANIASMLHALRRLGVEPQFTRDKDAIVKADRVILPGVGAAAGAMQKLRSFGLVELIQNLRQPVLGVCLGMQLLFESSEEGNTALLGVIPGRVMRFPDHPDHRVPHMGWNQVTQAQNMQPWSDDKNNWFYFVHSFYVPVSEFTTATAMHGITFSAVVRNKNFTGAQFHPERSATAGAQLLSGFLEGTL